MDAPSQPSRASLSDVAGSVHRHPEPHSPVETAKVALGALGIVYGDIGTSPLSP